MKKTLRQRIIRRLDRGWLRITNPFRDHALGYVEKVGSIGITDGELLFSGWEFDGLGTATAFDLTGKTMRIVGFDTGIKTESRIKMINLSIERAATLPIKLSENIKAEESRNQTN